LLESPKLQGGKGKKQPSPGEGGRKGGDKTASAPANQKKNKIPRTGGLKKKEIVFPWHRNKRGEGLFLSKGGGTWYERGRKGPRLAKEKKK